MHLFILDRTSSGRAAGRAVATVSLFSATICIAGCGANLYPPNAVVVTGNWQVTPAGGASKLPIISGYLKGSSAGSIGIFHGNGQSSCLDPQKSFEVSGYTDKNLNFVLLGGGLPGGGILTATGHLADDAKSIAVSSYSISGGSCATSASSPAAAQSYESVSGSYTGSFQDSSGYVIPVSATLTQTTNADANGNFQVSGSATFPSNPCFSGPVAVTNSMITGGNFDITYTDNNTQNSVEAIGSFAPNGSSLTVTSWTLNGPCGPDSGAGSLAK